MTDTFDDRFLKRVAQTSLVAGGVFELRLLDVPGQGILSGYFDDPVPAAEMVRRFDGKAGGIYILLNPGHPDLLARVKNRLHRPKRNETTSDRDILRRCWFLVDFDPVRVSGISSTDEEHRLALAVTWDARDWLSAQGWPRPLMADSGNGGHLLYRVDLPNDPNSTKLLQRTLKSLAAKFDTDRVKVDAGTFNAARISRLYGTKVLKGENLPERPHRRSIHLEEPDGTGTDPD